MGTERRTHHPMAGLCLSLTSQLQHGLHFVAPPNTIHNLCMDSALIFILVLLTICRNSSSGFGDFRTTRTFSGPSTLPIVLSLKVLGGSSWRPTQPHRDRGAGRSWGPLRQGTGGGKWGCSLSPKQQPGKEPRSSSPF